MNLEELISHGRDRAHFAGGGKVGALLKVLEEGFPEYTPGLKKLIKGSDPVHGDEFSHPAVDSLAATWSEHPEQYHDHLDEIAKHHGLDTQDVVALHQQALLKAGEHEGLLGDEGDYAHAKIPKDPLEQVPWDTDLENALEMHKNWPPSPAAPKGKISSPPKYFKSTSEAEQSKDFFGKVAQPHVVGDAELAKSEAAKGNPYAQKFLADHDFPPPEDDLEDEHSYTPSGSKLLTGVNMDALAKASSKNAAALPNTGTDQAKRIIQAAVDLPEGSDKYLLQHFIRNNQDYLTNKYSNARSIVNPGGGGYFTVGKGAYGTNDQAFLDLMKKYGFDPMLGNDEYKLMRDYSAGHYSQASQTEPEHDALNNLIQQYGVQVPSDTTLYKGMYAHTQGKPWAPSDEWHNPTSYSTDPHQAESFMPPQANDSRTLVRLHNPGQMMPLPISGESELVLPGGAAGRLKILEQQYDPKNKYTTVDAERYPFSEYAEGGPAETKMAGVTGTEDAPDPTGEGSLRTLAKWAREFGGPQHAEDRARLAAGVAQNFYGLDPQGHVSLMRSHQPGVIDQFLAMPGSMAHLAGLVAQAGAASKWNPLHSMMPNTYDAGTAWLVGPHPTSDLASERLQQLHEQVSKAMNVPEASGLKEHVLDAAGMLATPIPGGALAKEAPMLQRILEMAGPVAPPTLRRYVGDSTAFGAINSVPEALAALKAHLGTLSSNEDPQAEEQAPEAYAEGGQVLQFLRSMLIHVPHDMPGSSVEEKTQNTIAQGFATQRRAQELLDRIPEAPPPNEAREEPSEFSQRMAARSGAQKVDISIPPVMAGPHVGGAYDSFHTEQSGPNSANIFGVKDGKRYKISTTRPDVAEALAEAYNSGGYSTKGLEPVPLTSLFKESMSPEMGEALSGDLNISVTPEDLQKASLFQANHQGSTDYGNGMIEHHVKISAPPNVMKDYQNALSEIE